MGVPGLPTRFVPDASGGWSIADGWVLHGKSFDQRDGTEGYDPESDPSSLDNTDNNVDDGNLPPGDSLSNPASATASNSANAGIIGSAVATVAASATAALSPTSTLGTSASGTAVVAGHNVGASVSSSSSSSSLGSPPTDLPTGWEPGPSRTAYYTVPLVISLTLILTGFIVGTIALLVWRNQRKKKQLSREAAKLGEDGGSADGDMWEDVERLRLGVEKEMERRRRKEEKEARKSIKTWLGAESKWRARLFLRKRGARRRKGEASKSETSQNDAVEAVSTSVDGSRPSGSFVRSGAPSPSPHISGEDDSQPAVLDSQHISSPNPLSRNATRFLPSASSSRSPSPSSSIPAFRPPAYPENSEDDDQPIASTSTAPIRQVYPDLPPSPPTPPPGLRTLVIPSRAHVATDDKRILARMTRATYPRASLDAGGVAPEVPEWEDEELPISEPPPEPPSAPPLHEEADYVPLPPRSIAPEDEMFSFSGINLPPPPPAFQHAVSLDPTVPFDPGLVYDLAEHGEAIASAPFEDWDEYGEASAPPLEEDEEHLNEGDAGATSHRR